MLIAGVIIHLESLKPQRSSTGGDFIVDSLGKETKAARFEPAKEISTPDGFINIDKVKVADLIGKKVVLVDFWTYSCINCQRTTPYLASWYEKYKDKGLEIIGLHTPEFEFEKKYENVLAAVKKFGIKYPVVLDNDYSTWTSYHNQYWPRKYLIDIDGFIVYDHIGEGAYEETERKIQELLEERAQVLGMDMDVTEEVTPDPVKSDRSQSPETYFGATRNSLLANGQAGKTGRQSFSIRDMPEFNRLYLSGEWDIQSEYATNLKKGTKIVFRYGAKKVHMVASADKEVSVRIFKDGKLYSTVKISADGLYTLIDDQSAGEHLLEIIIDNPGLKVFTFTFS